MSAAPELSAAESAALTRLARAGRLTESDLARARRLAEEGGEALLPMLLRLGLVAERALAEALAAELGLELVEPERFPGAPVAEERFTPRFLKDARVLPLAERDGVLEVALANPADPFVVQAVRLAAAGPVRLAVALPSVLEQSFERLYEAAPEPAAEEPSGEIDATDIEQLKDLASEAPVIRMVNQLLQRAVEARASDIHLEPFADTLRVRYRVDGVLQEVEAPPVRSSAAVISRVKIMARLNIAERRLPQDGRIPLRVQGRELDLRVSTVPTLFGESLVIRLLDKDRVRFDLDALGFDGALRARLDRVLEHPYGILLVTGPTGSGKSTTLYTLLARLNTESRKIITVEDPVEYQLAGINQIPVRPAIGMTFASALRAIVRQDPDVIMVGEMRDLETARIAVQSALTGHLVLSTLHTNDAASGATRLLEMGVEDYLLTSTVNGILAQRLVRRLCPHCRARYRADAELAARLGLATDALELHRAVGCDACRGTGYHGRLVIGELLILSEAVRAAVLDHAGAAEIRRIARAEGMVTMFEDGVTKARAGLTSIEEVLRVAED
ncbi:type II secretion system ATPase GspE [Marichromatium gracile]|uniref:Type II secretion system protein E n=1 Tax=Marichromatium gracile TaxID=1048 RepID=A0A4R4AKX0_MARGR|nr:type II secretion system ATPase GspE [Marichromatium gracile]MBK1707555.1 type II secretion system protein GspE [Marichromatium gracile]TCW39905.1 type II secretion system protein E (GspE) [Marichromatium gracile]